MRKEQFLVGPCHTICYFRHIRKRTKLDSRVSGFFLLTYPLRYVFTNACLEAAIDANAPVHDDVDGNGPIDSDEEKDAVMAGLTRSNPQPMLTHPLISTRRKYHIVRMKEMLSHALGGARGSIFSTGDSPVQGRNLFASPGSPTFMSPVGVAPMDGPMQQQDSSSRKSSISQQAMQNRASQAASGAMKNTTTSVP